MWVRLIFPTLVPPYGGNWPYHMWQLCYSSESGGSKETTVISKKRHDDYILLWISFQQNKCCWYMLIVVYLEINTLSRSWMRLALDLNWTLVPQYPHQVFVHHHRGIYKFVMLHLSDANCCKYILLWMQSAWNWCTKVWRSQDIYAVKATSSRIFF